MNSQKMVVEWQRKIVACCEAKLERRLSAAELQASKQFSGFQALDMIEDTVNNVEPNEIASYLASI